MWRGEAADRGAGNAAGKRAEPRIASDRAQDRAPAGAQRATPGHLPFLLGDDGHQPPREVVRIRYVDGNQRGRNANTKTSIILT